MKIVPILSCIAVTACISFTSCNGRNGKGKSADTQNFSQTKTSILLPDADTVLGSWSKENVVVNHTIGEPDNLHPTNGGTAGRSWIMQYTYNYVMRTDIITLGLIPDLAAEMPEVSDNKLSYTYTLRKDARWDDGAPITAEDVAFMVKAEKCPLTQNASNKVYFENIKTVKTDPKDPYTFTVVMKKEYILNAYIFTDYPVIERKYYDPGNVLSHYTYEQFDDTTFHADKAADLVAWANNFNDAKYGNDLSLQNGSGPYKVTEWTPGQTITLERKKDHWTAQLENPDLYHASFPEKIIFKLNTDENSTMLEFKNQTIDVSAWVTTSSALTLMQDPNFMKNYNIQFIDNFSFNYMGFNMQPDGTSHQKYFDDVRVRKACALLVPVDEIIQVVAHGYAKRQASFVSPLKPEYNTDLKMVPYNVDSAKALLDAAGWKDTDGDNIRDKMINGKKVQMYIELKYQAGLQATEDLIKMVKESMYQAGIDIIPNGMIGGTLKQQLMNHDFDMYMSAWSPGSAPVDYTQVWHTSSYGEGGSNYVGFGNQATDALIDSIKYNMDEPSRIEMSKRFQKEIYDQQPYIFLYSVNKKIVIHKRFGNQYMTFDRPNVVLNNLRLLTLYGRADGAAVVMSDVQ